MENTPNEEEFDEKFWMDKFMMIGDSEKRSRLHPICPKCNLHYILRLSNDDILKILDPYICKIVSGIKKDRLKEFNEALDTIERILKE